MNTEQQEYNESQETQVQLSAVSLTPDILKILEETREGAMEEIEAAGDYEADTFAADNLVNDKNIPSGGSKEDLIHYMTKNDFLVGNHELVEKLLRTGDLNSCGYEGCTALMHLIRQGLSDTVKWLLRFDVDVNISDHYGNNALASLMMSKDVYGQNLFKELINLLLKNGADLNSMINGVPFIIHCYKTKTYDIENLRLKYGDSININLPILVNGDTMLNLAIEGYDKKTIEFLLKVGADPNIKNNDGLDSYEYAMRLAEKYYYIGNHSEIGKYIFEHPAYKKNFIKKIERYFAVKKILNMASNHNKTGEK